MFRPRPRPVRLFIPPLYSDRHLRLHKTHLGPEFLQLRPRGLAADVDAASLLPSVRRPHPPRDAARRGQLSVTDLFWDRQTITRGRPRRCELGGHEDAGS